MDLVEFLNFLLSSEQRLNVRLEVDNLMIAKALAVQRVVSVFELIQPKSIERKKLSTRYIQNVLFEMNAKACIPQQIL